MGVATSAAVLWWVAAESTAGGGAAADPLVLLSQPPSTAAAPGSTSASATVATSATQSPLASRSLASSVATRPAPAEPTATSGASVELGQALLGQSTSWQDVLERLDRERSAAFAAGDAALLTRVYAAGSAPLERDAAALDELHDHDLQAVGLAMQIEHVSLVAATLEQASLRVVDRLPAYRLVDTGGSTVQTLPGRASVTWLVTLTAGPDGWRISDIVSD